MNAQEAMAVAQAAAPMFGMPNDYRPAASELRIIELVDGAPLRDELPPPGPVLDRTAWIVRFERGILWFELAIDDNTRDVLRVRRSRSAAQAIDMKASDG